MAHLTFPFLLLTRRGSYRSVTIGDDQVKHAVAFTTTARAGEFMTATGESNWEFALIARTGLRSVVDDLIAKDLAGICLDPAPNETGGTSIKIPSLAAISEEALA
jgi:hypothetical protein